MTHGHVGYKEHDFAFYGQGKRILNSSNHCILNVLAEETDRWRNSRQPFCGKHVREE